MCVAPLTLIKPRDQWEPKLLDNKEVSYNSHVVPCGKCVDCLRRRQHGWSFRLYHQQLVSDTACFMTLTYGENYCNKTGEYVFGEDAPISDNGFQTLDRKDLTDFLHRLRKYQRRKLNNNETIKYYAVGEYGTDNLRPHYHIIMYNLDPHLVARSHLLAKKIWKKGSVDIASCTPSSINYVVGYVMQGSHQKMHRNDDRTPQFSQQSKGLGQTYLTDAIIDYHYDRMDASVQHPDGFRISLPRYYKDKIFTVEEKAELWEIQQEINKTDWQEFVDYCENDAIQTHLRGKRKTYKHEQQRKQKRHFSLDENA